MNELDRTHQSLEVILESNDSQALGEFLQKGSLHLSEGITGLLASDNTTKILIGGKLVQAAIKGNLLTQLGKEFQRLRDAGKIKENLFENENRKAALSEMLSYIDSDLPDAEVFNAMKSIFFASLSVDSTERDEMLAYQLLKICRRLESGDLLVLKVAFNHIGELEKNGNYDINWWLTQVADELGFSSEMVSIFEDHLIQTKLLSERKHPDKSGIMSPDTYRLTGLGLQMGTFFSRAESINK